MFLPSLSTVLDAWEKVWSVLGITGNTFQWLYHSKRWFHQWIKYVWFWGTNATAYWDAHFEFQAGDGERAGLQHALGEAVAQLGAQRGFQLITDRLENKVVRADGIIFELSCSGGPITVQVSDQKVSFRESKRAIDEQLLPVLEVLENSLPRAQRSYSLTARFGSSRNPYLSEYLKRIGSKEISTFQCTYLIDPGPNVVTVSVNLDSISVVTTSRASFQNASKKVLVLSHP